MKKPWLNFVGICSLVFAIVIFCVIFGGYSSLVRSQNRINAAKNYLADQSLIQLDQIDSLLALVPTGEDMAKTLNQTADKTNMIISKIKEAEKPIHPDLLMEYEILQQTLNNQINELVDKLKSTNQDSTPAFKEMQTKMADAQVAVFVTGKRYNKEAQYFNTRTRVFPGFIIARLFGLDKIHFKELDISRLSAYNEKEADSAS